MWKSSHTQTSPVPSECSPLAPAVSTFKPGARFSAPARDQAMIGKAQFFKGNITGSESLFIDGSLEGSIDLPGNHVTVGPNGQVTASIVAGDIVVLGTVCGNLTASNRVDIRAQGSVTGDVRALRLCIEDGSFLKGSFDVCKTGTELADNLDPAADVILKSRAFHSAKPETGTVHLSPFPQSA